MKNNSFYNKFLYVVQLLSFVTSLQSEIVQDDQNNFTLYKFDQSSLAICNDGSMSGYYFRQGKQSQRWIIFLQGGGFCFTPECFKQRSKYLMSSKNWPSTTTKNEGLFNQDCDVNPYWCEANAVFVNYCTSDYYTGDRGSSDQTFGLQFRGSRVIDAVFDDLVKNRELDSQSEEILWTGASAGGRGAYYNLYKAEKRIPNAKALQDSSWWLVTDTYEKSIMSFEEKTKFAYYLFNSKFDERCVKGNAYQPWLCTFPYKSEKYPTMERMTQAFQYDQYQMYNNCSAIRGFDQSTFPKYQEYAENFRSTMIESFKSVNAKNSKIYAPACQKHCSTESNTMFEININGVTLGGFLKDWFLGNLADGVSVLADTCVGVNCSGQCPQLKLPENLETLRKIESLKQSMEYE